MNACTVGHTVHAHPRRHANVRRASADPDAHRSQHVLGVIARRLRGSEQRLAFGLERRKHDSCLGLATRNLKMMVDARASHAVVWQSDPPGERWCDAFP
jgi:hypothetical protein